MFFFVLFVIYFLSFVGCFEDLSVNNRNLLFSMEFFTDIRIDRLEMGNSLSSSNKISNDVYFNLKLFKYKLSICLEKSVLIFLLNIDYILG